MTSRSLRRNLERLYLATGKADDRVRRVLDRKERMERERVRRRFEAATCATCAHGEPITARDRNGEWTAYDDIVFCIPIGADCRRDAAPCGKWEERP